VLYAGIDEAGYGPTLGPLCIGAAIFAVEADPGSDPPDLWKTLRSAVCRASARSNGAKVAVDDSKRLKRQGSFDDRSFAHSVELLERGVLSFLHASGAEHHDDAALLEALRGRVATGPEWYRASAPLPLPVASDGAALRLTGGRLARVCASTAVTVRALRCVVLDERVFNARLARTGSKAAVSGGVVSAMLGRLWSMLARSEADREAVVAVDRQGGRTRYEAMLRRRLPDAAIRVVEESPDRSAYEATADGPTGPRRMRVSFQVECERSHLPVALASMTAKYARELMMRRFNAYWGARIAELKPTAGYATDARRWLRDASPHLSEAERADLVRRA